jgi:predicted PurR-regulated permease PerM
MMKGCFPTQGDPRPANPGSVRSRPMTPQSERTRVVGFTIGSVVAVVVAVFVAYRLRNAFVAAHQVLGWVVACAIVALLIDPLVDRLQRRLPRWLAVVVVVTGLLAAFGVVLAGVVRELSRSLDELERAVPRAATELEQRYDWAADVGVAQRVDSLIDGLDAGIRHEAVGRAIGTVPTYVVTGILMLFLLAYGRRYVDGAIGLFDDPARRESLHAVVGQAGYRGRTYMLCALGNGALNGIVFGVVCQRLSLPAPLSLGVAVGVFSVFPLVGVIVGSVPALLLAFGSQSWWVGAIVVIVAVALQLVEAVVVRPSVDRRTVRLGPTTPIVVALVAFDLYGVGGAVYAIALAILGLAALDAIGRRQGDDVEDLAVSGGQDEQLERA